MIKRVVILQDEQLVVREIQRNMQRALRPQPSRRPRRSPSRRGCRRWPVPAGSWVAVARRLPAGPEPRDEGARRA